jgi:dihydrofolate reductase
MRITYYVAASLDGFIATSDGGVDWLESVGIPMDQTGYDEFFASIDGIIVGRKTYEQMLGFGPWAFGDKPTWVCASRKVDVATGCDFRGVVPPAEAVSQAQTAGLTHLWLLGGGVLAASMLKEKLLTHVSVSTLPILLGEGIGLFQGLDTQVALELESSKQFDCGFIQHTYRIAQTG